MPARLSLKKLRNQLLGVNLVSLTLVIAVAFSLIYINFYNRTQNEIDKAISEIPRGVLENWYASSGHTVTAVPFPGNIRITISGGQIPPVDYTKAFVANIKKDGSVSVFSMLDLDEADYAQAVVMVLDAESPTGSLKIADRNWRYTIEDYSKIVFYDIDDANRELRALAISLVLIGALAIGAIFLISLRMANRAIRPVEESMARQRRFVADASHELKNPIAVIAANAEAAADAAGGSGNEELSRWIGNIEYETGKMGELVENLITLVKTEEKPALDPKQPQH